MDKASSSELNAIESVMLSSLQPVDPRPEFVEGLHQRLTDPMSPTVRFTRQYSSQFILLIIATVLSGIVFILTASRVIISLIREFRLTKFK
ncbi:MAG: hypothetical protein WA997_13290 [Anaerolineales bacterium]|jgi:hypothetical protein|nr:hypothetical protein [Anaerolineales bacterium]